jgi:hypothetical protein
MTDRRQQLSLAVALGAGLLLGGALATALTSQPSVPVSVPTPECRECEQRSLVSRAPDPLPEVATPTRVLVETDTVSPEEEELRAEVIARDSRIAELEAENTRLRSASLASQFVGVKHIDGDEIHQTHVANLLAEIAEGDKFVTLQEVETMVRSLGPQNTFHVLNGAASAFRNLYQRRSGHKLNSTPVEHRAWLEHEWPAVVADELQARIDDFHRLGANGFAVESFRQKATDAFLR